MLTVKHLTRQITNPLGAGSYCRNLAALHRHPGCGAIAKEAVEKDFREQRLVPEARRTILLGQSRSSCNMTGWVKPAGSCLRRLMIIDTCGRCRAMARRVLRA